MGWFRDCLNLYLQHRWLNAIKKELNNYNWTVDQLNRQLFVVAGLVKRYNELFGDDLRIRQKGGASE